jgi:V/A-type H+/Na+-transporting ATPase subunit D
MGKVALNKSALQKERDKLKLYQRLLPSLDLKRRQLSLELGRARAELAKSQAEFERLEIRATEQLPMLADIEKDLTGFVRIRSVKLDEENIVGVRLPILAEVAFTISNYSMLAYPYWIDVLVERLEEMAELQVRLHILAERVRRLQIAQRRITQRVNLFEKILIPNTKTTIHQIQIYLGDAERSAVVRSKIAKAMHKKQRSVLMRKGMTP